MKTEQEIRAKFNELVEQRDKCPDCSASREMLNQRIRGLAWVIEHPLVTEIVLSDDARNIYDCLS
jgi:hypothetical protein